MSTRRSLIWSYGSQAFIFGVSFVSSIIVARLLSPYQMGVFAIATATAGFLYVLTTQGFQSYLVREGEIDRTMIRSVYTVNGIMNSILAVMIAAAALIEQRVFHEREIAAVLFITALGPLVSIFDFVPGALYQREMNYGMLSRVNMVRALINAVSVVACAFAGFGSLSPAFGPLLSGLFGAIFYNWRRRRDVVYRPSFRNLRPVMVYGFQMMSISGVAQLAQRASDLILGRMLGLSALGLYSRASNLSSLVFFNVYGLATGVVFTRLAQDLRETGSLRETFTLSLRMITAFVWPLMIGIAVLSRPAITILYGPKWIGAALPLSFLMIAQFVILGFGMNWELFVLRRETARQTRFEAFRALSGVGLFTIGCLFNIAAAALGRVLEAVVGYLLYRPHIDRLAGTEKGELERIFIESAGLTLVAVAPSAVLMAWTGWAADTSPALVALAVAAGIGLWLAVLARQHHPLLAEGRILYGKAKLALAGQRRGPRGEGGAI